MAALATHTGEKVCAVCTENPPEVVQAVRTKMEAKFYSVTENGQELQMLRSLPEAAELWEISTTRRHVYEVTPNHDAAGHPVSWTQVAEVPADELAAIMRKARE